MKKGWQILFLTALLCFAALLGPRITPPALSAPPPVDLPARVDAYIAETMRRLPIAGLAVAIVQGDQILYVQGYGVADGAGSKVTPQTPFMLASVTKTFTALAAHQLAAAGQLDLDAPLQTYLPEFRLADSQAAAAITVRQLVDHQSGLSTLEGSQPYLHSPGTTLEKALAHLAQYKPKQGPGSYEYSNWNYVLLGEVIARASGQPYTTFMQTHVLDPLEMSHASFADHHTLPDLATGHYISFGQPIPFDEPYVPVMTSAGYLAASAEEMAHYLIPYVNGGQYQGASLLPVQAPGWFDARWNWQPGRPNDISYSASGAHNSVNTAIQLFSLHKVGVAVLMNTRLDALLPAPNAAEIGFNLARIAINFPYEVPSNRGFYLGYALLDGFLLLLIAAILWQAARLKGWAKGYPVAAPRGRFAAWLGIVLDLLLAVGILLLPALLGSTWRVLLFIRTDVAVAFLVTALLLAALGVVKVALVVVQGRRLAA